MSDIAMKYYYKCRKISKGKIAVLPRQCGKVCKLDGKPCSRKKYQFPVGKESGEMTDTPRTDALMLNINEGRTRETVGPLQDHAEKLERELQTARAEINTARVALLAIEDKVDEDWPREAEIADIAREALSQIGGGE